jgi:hypothetical protein
MIEEAISARVEVGRSVTGSEAAIEELIAEHVGFVQGVEASAAACRSGTRATS